MKLEHFALNVEDPIKMAEWYVQHLKLKIVRQTKTSPFTTFMADSSGRVMIEIYNNPSVKVPDYQKMDPLVMHLAFVSKNPDVDRTNLVSAGATLESEIKLEDDSHLIMLRDPWGVPVQLCKRTIKLLEAEMY